MRSWKRTTALLLATVLWGPSAQAQTDPATRLQQLQPDLFTVDNTQNAALWGMQSVRLTAVGSSLQALGFQKDDVIVGFQGQALTGNVSPASNPVYTVVRAIPGQRPVLDASVVGRQMLEDFTGLPPTERTPMRLTRMTANGWTLMQEGRGVLLLPASASGDDAAWLQYATPLPTTSEKALQTVSNGVKERADLPVVDDEATAARQSFDKGDVLVAQERASRAVLAWVTSPDQRAASQAFDDLVQLYIDATAGVAQRRAELLAPAPRFGIFAEGYYSFIQAFLPQNTLIAVENSNGWGGRGGVRMRVWRWLDIMASYGWVDNQFKDAQGQTKIHTKLQPAVLELAYRPVVLSRLKPILRAGFGMYVLNTEVFQDDGTKVADLTDTNWGLEFGGGIDAFYWKKAKIRGTAQISFRLLEFTYAYCDEGDGCSTQFWPRAANLPPGSNYDPANPQAFLENGRYTLNMNGWMLGFMLTKDF